MKTKLIASILSVPTAYLIWQLAGEQYSNHVGTDVDALSNMINFYIYSLVILALVCTVLNAYVFALAIKAKDQRYATITAVYALISVFASLAPIVVVVWLYLRNPGGA